MAKHARNDDSLMEDYFASLDAERVPQRAQDGFYGQPPADARSFQESVADDMKRAKKRKGRGWRVVFVVALVVLVASLTALGVIAFSYFQGQQKYSEIAETAGVDPNDLSGDASKIASLDIDWKALRKANPDVVGWLFIPGTVINYPVVQGEDNEYYLYHDFDGEAGWLADYGAIFIDHANKKDWTDPCYFVYGHHMNDGSMFADIAGLADQARFDECRTSYLLTPHGNFTLRSFALVHADASATIVMTKFSSKKEMNGYIQDKMDRSIVEVKDAPKAKDMAKIFAFSTCDNYSDGRFILYSYMTDTTVEGLTGEIGIAQEDGAATGFVEDLEVQ